MEINFGAPSAPAAGSSALSGNSFSFGGINPSPAAGVTVAASTGGGFSFGNASTTAAPSAFGGSTPIQAAGSPSGFGFSKATPGDSYQSSGESSAGAAHMISADIPKFETCFPYLKVKSVVSEILPAITPDTSEGCLKGEELIYRMQIGSENGVFGALLANPKPLKFTPADLTLRQKLQQNPHIKLHGQSATLTPAMMEEIEKLCSQLRISELEAIALYAEASNPVTRQVLEGSLETSFVENALVDQRKIIPLVIGGNVVKAAKELYFWERSALLKALLLLIQSRLDATPKSAILLATDPLLNSDLIANLITFVRDSTTMIFNLKEEMNSSSSKVSLQFGPVTKAKPVFGKVLLEFLVQERQQATECLFYLGYHTQCTAIEVALLIDVVRDLTNGLAKGDIGLPILDPTQDVPDVYINQDLQERPYGHGFTSALPPLKEKDPIVWRKDLIEKTWNSGVPQLQQCVSVLLTTILCTLDGRTQLWDRNTHSPNNVGNALYLQGESYSSCDVYNIGQIHRRLDPQNDAGRAWKRQDIWGLLAGAYGVLLVPLHSVLASPRVSGQISVSGEASLQSSDVRRTGKACLSAAYEKKSLTFARLTLIPSFQRHRDGPDSKCDLYEFLMSVTAGFVSHYIDILAASPELPASRTMWEENENENLKVQRDQQEQQRQFNLQYGAIYDPPPAIPLQIDVLQRPDCIDDIVFLACVICSAGPHFASRFWSTDDGRFVPSRLLSKLEFMKNLDDTLVPAYLSFLASLTTADTPNTGLNGANVVHQILSEQPAADSKHPVTWMSILTNIRWYARRLDTRYQATAKSMSSSSPPTAGSYGEASTAYYYGAENTSFSGNGGYVGSSTTAISVKDTDTKTTELGDGNTAILMSHLAVISRVAADSPSARVALLSMALPIDTSGVASLDEDPILLVLFSLAMVGLTPNVRGAVFATIASLLRIEGANADEKRIVREMAHKAWELLELSNIVPISVLAQFQAPGSVASIQGMAFPPSSLALASTGERKSILQQDTKFGILFEMEHVESRMGYYPSTEGLLQLINALISSVGCPQDLGKSVQGVTSGRTQLGCSPYVEYVIHFVLPRAVGSDSSAGLLPFRSCCDQDRLIAMAMEIVESIITHYSVPSIRPGSPIPLLEDDIKNQKDAISTASQQFRLPSFANSLVIESEESEVQGYRLDFMPSAEHKRTGEELSSFPRPKSPGYMIISEILSIYCGELFTSLILSIARDGADIGVRSICGWDGYKAGVSLGLFRDFCPSTLSARSKSAEGAPASLSSFLQPLFINLDVKSNRKMLTNDSVVWRELSMLRSLLILCAAAAREDAFIAASSGCTTIVPVLRFKAKMSSISTISTPLSKLKNLFINSQGCSTLKFLQILTRLIGYSSCSADQYIFTSSSALALTVYACNAMSLEDSVRVLGGAHLFASSVSYRLRASIALHAESTDHAEIVDLIFSLIDQRGISDVLLGFYSPQKAPMPRIPLLESNDCFDTVLSLIQDEAFVTNPATSQFAAKCYEIIYRQISRDDAVSAIVAKKLNDSKFWMSNLWRFFACREAEDRSLLGALSEESAHILQSTAWFLKSLTSYISSTQEFDLLELVSSPHYFLLQAFDNIPLTTTASVATYPNYLLPMVDAAMIPLKGPVDVVSGYNVVSQATLETKLLDYNPGMSEATINNMLSWAKDWNRSAEWECATSHVSHACTLLLECCLACIYDTLAEPSLRENTAEGQIQLLTLVLQRLCTVSDAIVLKSTASHMCTSVLFLVERLVLANDPTLAGAVAYFFTLMVRATSGAFREDTKSTESAALLGGAMIILLSMHSNFEISEDQNDEIGKVICSFATLGSELVNGVCVSNVSGERAALSLISRTFLSSLLTHFNIHENHISLQPLVGKTVITPLVRALSMLDDDVPYLLAQLATIDEGALNLIRFGIMQALESACQVYKKKEAEILQELSIGAMSTSDLVGVPSFLGRHFELLVTLLATKAIKPSLRHEIASQALVIFSRYMFLLERARQTFPRYGDMWTALVKCLLLSASILYQQEPCFVRPKHIVSPDELFIALKQFVAPVALDILQHPFPQQFLIPLPLKLRSDDIIPQRSQDTVQWNSRRTWWQGIEEEMSAKVPDMIIMPPPLSFHRIDGTQKGKGDSWSNYKYDVCFDGMRLLDKSLSLLAGKHGESFFRLDCMALARGLCCLVDSFKAIEGRLLPFDFLHVASTTSSNLDGMEIDDDKDGQFRIKMERAYLVRLLPLFERCIEKLLLLINNQFKGIKSSMGSSEWRRFAEAIHVVLDRFDWASLNIGKDDYLAKSITNLRAFANETEK